MPPSATARQEAPTARHAERGGPGRAFVCPLCGETLTEAGMLKHRSLQERFGPEWCLDR